MGRSIRRGIIIFGLGYLLNFLRGTLPVIVGVMLGNITLEDMSITSPFYYMLEIDILQFAGLAFIVLALVRRFIKKPAFIVILGCVIALIGDIISKLTAGWAPLDYLFQLLWGTADYTFFPLLPWISFGLFGLAFGNGWLNSKDNNKFYMRSVCYGIASIIIGFIISYTSDELLISDFFARSFMHGVIPSSVIFLIAGFIPIWLALYHVLAAKIPENNFFKRLSNWSKSVTPFYCLQWIIIGWLTVFIWDLEVLAVIIFTLGIIVLTEISLTIYKGIITFGKGGPKKSPHL